MDIFEDVLADIDKQYYPTLKFRWGAHDSQKWDMTIDHFENDTNVLKQAAGIVQQVRLINGRYVKFPASFYVTFDDGRTEVWKP